MVKRFEYAHTLIGVLLGVVLGLLLCLPVLSGQDDKSRGKVWIRIIEQQKDAVLAQPMLPPTFQFRLDTGNLNGQKTVECEQWTITKQVNGVKYPSFELHCGVVSLSLIGLDMTQEFQSAIR